MLSVALTVMPNLDYNSKAIHLVKPMVLRYMSQYRPISMFTSKRDVAGWRATWRQKHAGRAAGLCNNFAGSEILLIRIDPLVIYVVIL